MKIGGLETIFLSSAHATPSINLTIASLNWSFWDKLELHTGIPGHPSPRVPIIQNSTDVCVSHVLNDGKSLASLIFIAIFVVLLVFDMYYKLP